MSISERLDDIPRQFARIVGANQPSSVRTRGLTGRADVARNDRHATGLGLEQGNRQSLVTGRQHEQVEARI